MTEEDSKLVKAIRAKAGPSFGYFVTTRPMEEEIGNLTDSQIDMISSRIAASLMDSQYKIIEESKNNVKSLPPSTHACEGNVRFKKE